MLIAGRISGMAGRVCPGGGWSIITACNGAFRNCLTHLRYK